MPRARSSAWHVAARSLLTAERVVGKVPMLAAGTLERLVLNPTLMRRAALEAGLVTFGPDDIDWEDEVIKGALLTRGGSVVNAALTGEKV